MDTSKISFRINVDVKYEQLLYQVIDDYNNVYQTDFYITDVYVHTDGLCFCAIEVSEGNEQHIFELGYRLARAENKENCIDG